VTRPGEATESFHGTVVAWHGSGVLFRGTSGRGKSDLALSVIARGGMLVADDQVVVTRSSDGITAQAPPILAGLIELRGVGLIRMPYLMAVRLSLVIDLVASASVERLPDFALTGILGHALPQAVLAPFEHSAVPKLIGLLRSRPDL